MNHELYRKVSEAVQDGGGDDQLLLLALLAGVVPRQEIERAMHTVRAARERVEAA